MPIYTNIWNAVLTIVCGQYTFMFNWWPATSTTSKNTYSITLQYLYTNVQYLSFLSQSDHIFWPLVFGLLFWASTVFCCVNHNMIDCLEPMCELAWSFGDVQLEKSHEDSVILLSLQQPNTFLLSQTKHECHKHLYPQEMSLTSWRTLSDLCISRQPYLPSCIWISLLLNSC